eukprot:gnl/Trimastix_PCT/780.p1 GENE.gnl/Trimastix_PCT/780~~gnl/Trimastix_PCT/780.p1  ORF type:complete len:197 (-),score=46.98 gnl/Trimastix_PCT/780:82-672(-)
MNTREALRQWQQRTGEDPAEATELKLYYQNPPIEKMDNSLVQCKNCRKLSLSTNRIERIANLSGLDALEILSLGRNLIKRVEGLEPVSATLRELWISYNHIERLAGVLCCKRLVCLSVMHNQIERWAEVDRLAELPELVEVSFAGNPIHENSPNLDDYRSQVIRRLPHLKKLDGAALLSGDSEEEEGATATATTTT